MPAASVSVSLYECFSVDLEGLVLLGYSVPYGCTLFLSPLPVSSSIGFSELWGEGINGDILFRAVCYKCSFSLSLSLSLSLSVFLSLCVSVWLDIVLYARESQGLGVGEEDGLPRSQHMNMKSQISPDRVCITKISFQTHKKQSFFQCSLSNSKGQCQNF